jgi:hypothetical protein
MTRERPTRIWQKIDAMGTRAKAAAIEGRETIEVEATLLLATLDLFHRTQRNLTAARAKIHAHEAGQEFRDLCAFLVEWDEQGSVRDYAYRDALEERHDTWMERAREVADSPAFATDPQEGA